MRNNFNISSTIPSLISICILNLLFIIYTNAQVPEIEWQNTIGGYEYDNPGYLHETTDGGYILAGQSTSDSSLDKSENSNGVFDIWVLKLNKQGSIVWQNTIGGSGGDYVGSINQTSDGGFIIGGYSESNISGDKTENSIGYYDYWVVKIDSHGNIEWQNTIGGNEYDFLKSACQTNDGGYILGGYSYSGISGDKTEANHGFSTSDYWLVKLDASGNIEWQNTIGGGLEDFLYDVKQTSDGGYLLGGYSCSGISGDKNETCFGGFDYWVLKLDAMGNIIWQNTIGGTGVDRLNSVIETNDHGFMLAGSSDSEISGDKTDSCKGETDFWLLKINPSGNIEWQKTIGGNSYDEATSINQTADGGYITGGNSRSNISGDKTESNKGETDYWVIKIDESGNIEWQKNIGGIMTEYLSSAEETIDGGFIISGESRSGISGSKTEKSHFEDFWVVKLYSGTESCVPPGGFFSNQIEEKIKINWLAVSDAVGYQLRYRIKGTEVWLLKNVIGKEFFILNALPVNTKFEYQIQSICSEDGSIRSDYSTSHYFITKSYRLGNETNDELIIYPNPSANQINILITADPGDGSIRIFNMNGEIVFETQVWMENDFILNLNTENFSNGIYLVEVITSDNKLNRKLIISH